MTSEFKRDWDVAELKADFAKLKEEYGKALITIADLGWKNKQLNDQLDAAVVFLDELVDTIRAKSNTLL